MTSTDMSADERRQERNRRRRAQRRVEGRLRMARHAAHGLVTYGEWVGGRPCATASDVIRATRAMYGGYLKGEDITPEEASVALRVTLTCDSYEESQAELRKAARRILAA
ncbi:hypothetical protein ACX6XY_17795 [Streptomyces sp. O3]